MVTATIADEAAVTAITAATSVKALTEVLVKMGVAAAIGDVRHSDLAAVGLAKCHDRKTVLRNINLLKRTGELEYTYAPARGKGPALPASTISSATPATPATSEAPKVAASVGSSASGASGGEGIPEPEEGETRQLYFLDTYMVSVHLALHALVRVHIAAQHRTAALCTYARTHPTHAHAHIRPTRAPPPTHTHTHFILLSTLQAHVLLLVCAIIL